MEKIKTFLIHFIFISLLYSLGFIWLFCYDHIRIIMPLPEKHMEQQISKSDQPNYKHDIFEVLSRD